MSLSDSNDTKEESVDSTPESRDQSVSSAESLSVDSNDSIDSNLSSDSSGVKKDKKIKLESSKTVNPLKPQDIISDEDMEKTRNEENKRLDRLRDRLKPKFTSNDSTIDSNNDFEKLFDYILHKNDSQNRPEKCGQVLVNIGHTSKERKILLNKKISSSLKPHQIGGIRFLFDNLIESVDQFKSTEGFGCILSHSMGLGKTLQIIVIIDVLLRHTRANRANRAKTVLIVLPINVLKNWVQEFKRWLPFRRFKVYSIHKKRENPRNRIINKWHSKGGVLLIGYEKYQLMSKNIRKIRAEKENNSKQVVEKTEKLYKALVDPGPHVVVCDEGHRLKNDSTNISKALKQIKTKRRVVLTGYPLQNNLNEYYVMIDYIRPNYLGNKSMFNDYFEHPITKGQCKDSTNNEKKLMRQRSHVLNELLKGFIQRRSEAVMETTLSSKQDIVLFCRLTPFQIKLIDDFLNGVLTDLNNFLVDNKGMANKKVGNRKIRTTLFRTFVVCSKICNHPDIIYNIFKEAKGVDADDLDPELNRQLISYSWAESHFKEDYSPKELEKSNKMVVLFDIIDKCVALRDKLLVFSQWLFTLDLIEKLLECRDVSNSGVKWRKGIDYYRLDGQTDADNREDLIKRFNSKKSAVKLFLISTKAGGVGVNLIGSNRIVIFDACWNPCHDAQASCRIYRFGQTKKCFIYRLISDNSLEKRIFNKQIFKRVLFDRVVDRRNTNLKLNKSEIKALLKELRRELKKLKTKPMLQTFDVQQIQRISNFGDNLLQNVCDNRKKCLTDAPFDHKSLFYETNDLELSSEEKKKAFNDYKEIQKH